MSPVTKMRVIPPFATRVARSSRRRGTTILAVGVSLAASLSGCGPGNGSTSGPTTSPVSTLALGPMPPGPSTQPPAPLPSSTTVTTVKANTVALGLPLKGPLATVASGNRALLIGDAVLKSATPAQGGDMCEAMNAFGWATTIAARSAAGTNYANIVLDEYFRPPADPTTTVPSDGDWDAVAIFLGTDLGTGVDPDQSVDVDAAIANIDAALEKLSPRPVLLVTVSVAGEHRSDMAAFNAALQTRYEHHPNIAVLDWAAITADDPAIVKKDGVSLSPNGVIQLGLRFASSFGEAPTTVPADTVETVETVETSPTTPVTGTSATGTTPNTAPNGTTDGALGTGSDLGCDVLATD